MCYNYPMATETMQRHSYLSEAQIMIVQPISAPLPGQQEDRLARWMRGKGYACMFQVLGTYKSLESAEESMSSRFEGEYKAEKLFPGVYSMFGDSTFAVEIKDLSDVAERGRLMSTLEEYVRQNKPEFVWEHLA